MLKEQRHASIIDLVNRMGFVHTSSLADSLKVTEMTIRRDLNDLAKNNMLKKVHGGAKRLESLTSVELSHSEKYKLNIFEKSNIAKLAASKINDNDTVFFGGGTTVEMVLDYLEVNSLNVITNSFSLFNKIKEDTRFEIVLIGGRFNRKTNVFVGSFAYETLKSIRIQKSFIGTSGINHNLVTTTNEDDARILNTAITNSEQSFILCDHSKLDKEDLYIIGELSEFSYMITDSNISEEVLLKYKTKTNILLP